MSILDSNGILAAAEKKIEASLTPSTREAYDKIVVAGLKVGLNGGKDGILAAVRHREDPIAACAMGAVNLVQMLNRQARNTMPPQALVWASMTLMLQALDFVDKAKIAPIDKADLDRATRLFMKHILQAFGVTPQKLTAMGAETQKIMADPARMDALARQVGIMKAPSARSQPSGIIDGAPIEEGAV